MCIRDSLIPDVELAGIAELGRLQIHRRHPDDREVSGLVIPDDLRLSLIHI